MSVRTSESGKDSTFAEVGGIVIFRTKSTRNPSRGEVARLDVKFAYVHTSKV